MSNNSNNSNNQSKPAPQQTSNGVKVTNKSARPITLIASSKKGDRVTLLPTESASLDKELFAKLEKNKAAMTFFESGDLVKG